MNAYLLFCPECWYDYTTGQHGNIGMLVAADSRGKAKYIAHKDCSGYLSYDGSFIDWRSSKIDDNVQVSPGILPDAHPLWEGR
jgi:hypothetical protein